MSTYILGHLATPDSALRDDDPKKPWLEALAALIPGEALIAYTSLIALVTEKPEGEAAAKLTREPLVVVFTLVIAAAIPFLYGIGSGGKLGKRHALRWIAALVAFAVWLWLLPLSVWDIVMDDLTKHVWSELDDQITRSVLGILAAFVVVTAAGFAFKKWELPGGGGAGQKRPEKTHGVT